MNKQQKAVSQQGIEILGDILSWGTDVPNARDHRRVLETLKLLRLNNTEMRSTVLSGTQTNRALLRSLHPHDSQIHSHTDLPAVLRRYISKFVANSDGRHVRRQQSQNYNPSQH